MPVYERRSSKTHTNHIEPFLWLLSYGEGENERGRGVRRGGLGLSLSLSLFLSHHLFSTTELHPVWFIISTRVKKSVPAANIMQSSLTDLLKWVLYNLVFQKEVCVRQFNLFNFFYHYHYIFYHFLPLLFLLSLTVWNISKPFSIWPLTCRGGVLWSSMSVFGLVRPESKNIPGCSCRDSGHGVSWMDSYCKVVRVCLCARSHVCVSKNAYLPTSVCAFTISPYWQTPTRTHTRSLVSSIK